MNKTKAECIKSSLIIVSISLLGLLIRDAVGYQSIGFFYLLGVLAISFFSNIYLILSSALVSALLWDYFFILPYGTFFISKVEDMMMCISYFIAAGSTGILTHRINSQKKKIERSEAKNLLLYSVSKCLTNEKSLDKALNSTIEHLTYIFQGNFFIILAKNNELDFQHSLGTKFSLDENEKALANWVFKKNIEAGLHTNIIPDSDALYFPLKTVHNTLGVLGFIPGDGRSFNAEQIQTINVITREISLVLEREEAAKKIQKNQELEQREKLYQALFSSISHELKTPLTTIIGVISSLLSVTKNSNYQIKDELLGELQDSATKLNYVVDNLLDAARIEAHKIDLNLEACDLEDLIHMIIAKNHNLLKNYDLIVEIKANIPLVKLDLKLFDQVLTNLILNAARYSKQYSKITIQTEFDTKAIYISINDCGCGIKEAEKEKIFEKFYRSEDNKSSGIGLGLYIVKQILDLHKASIELKTGDNQQGSKFIISIPRTDFKKYSEV